MKVILTSILLLLATVVQAADPTVEHLQAISVTVRADGGQGSGTLVTRGEHTFVWTAAHVIDTLRKTRTVTINGTSKTVIEFKDAEIVQEIRENGRRVGEVKMDAEVLRYSDSEIGEDLAILRIRKTKFSTDSAKFYLNKEIPALGTELYHVGSLLGQFGSNSLTTGIISQHGRVFTLGSNGTVFDQTTATAFPGSSGGGVYTKKDGQYVGMLVRGAGEGFNFIVPVRRMNDWAKANDAEWALNPAVPVPKVLIFKEDAGRSANFTK